MTVTGNDTALSVVTVSVVKKRMKKVFVPPAGMSFAEAGEVKLTVAAHAPLHPAGGVTAEHVQLPPPAGVATRTSFIV